ncbi:hypothetical protein TNCV_2792271 [Trichonephila clavipes]|nr:hypothetical protein TNCV_2792271 [Trichonephila clavipes]
MDGHQTGVSFLKIAVMKSHLVNLFATGKKRATTLNSSRGGSTSVSPQEARRIYSDDTNEINNAAPVPTSSEMRNIIKSMHSYLDANSSGEMNSKMDDIEPFLLTI